MALFNRGRVEGTGQAEVPDIPEAPVDFSELSDYSVDTASADFNNLGINAFESTFRALFNQANSQSTRLKRISHVLKVLENNLLTPEALEQLNASERLVLYKTLAEQADSITRELIALSKPFIGLRVIIGTFDGLRKHKTKRPVDV